MKIVQNKARKASAKLARSAIGRNRRSTPAKTFEASWEALLCSRLYRWLIQLGQNPYRDGTQLFGRTFELLSLGIPGFYDTAEIRISGNLKEAIKGEEPFLLVQLHDGHRFLSRVFADRHVTRIVGDPVGHINWLSSQGIDVARFHVIKDDVLSLMQLRKAVKNKHIIACVIDYMNAAGRQAYVNPAIMGFANAVKIPVYFVKSQVTAKGAAELISAGPYIDIDPVLCANMFLDFFNRVGTSRVSMEVKKYSEHSDWKMERRTLG